MIEPRVAFNCSIAISASNSLLILDSAFVTATSRVLDLISNLCEKLPISPNASVTADFKLVRAVCNAATEVAPVVHSRVEADTFAKLPSDAEIPE